MSRSVERRLASQQGELTDAAVDALSGVELDEQVAMSLGWIPMASHGEWRAPINSTNPLMLYRRLPVTYHTDTGAALGLLMGLDVSECGWGISYSSDGLQVYSELQGEPLAVGEPDKAAECFCRAYLKIVSRKGRV